jgi:hypothetical protein
LPFTDPEVKAEILPATATDKLTEPLTDKPAPAFGSDALIGVSHAQGEDYPATSKGVSGKGPETTKGNFRSGMDAQITTAPGEKLLINSREQIFEPHRTITTIVIKRNGKTSVYHQVQYLNGNCFYFMNGATAISGHLFEYFTGENR